MPVHLVIRSMRLADLDFAEECIKHVGWIGEGKTDFETYFDYDPEGCLIAEAEGEPGGICIATSYKHTGFIGDLIVHEKLRGQGIGAQLLNHAVKHLEQMGASSVYLDSAVKAVPLYERNGFRKICRTLMYTGKVEKKAHAEVRPMRSEDLKDVFELDYRAFGADRSFFMQKRLDNFPQLCQVMIDQKRIVGYIAGRMGETWAEAGPWVVEEGDTDPFLLLESLACNLKFGEISFSLLENNMRMTGHPKMKGFIQSTENPWRMALGEDHCLGTSTMCCAVGNLSKG